MRILPSLLLFYGAAGAFGSASAAGECGGENQRKQYDRERHPEEERERAAACEIIVIALEVDEADNGGHDVCHVAAQAVGQAVGNNPISIIIPCHRVVGSDGNLTGYAGGLDIKMRLLEFEGIDMTKLFLPKKRKNR